MQRMPSCSACGAVLADSARFCQACGAPADGRPSPDERKLATVLFADLVGSTALGSSQDPERTRALLDRFYDAMAAEVEFAGGTVEKFAGDAVMAAFGAPAAVEDHAERALHAALAMRRRLAALFAGDLSLRIGVNTGDVVVGRPREGSSFVTGDAVNVAARLEQAAATDEILVGERTAGIVRGAFELGEPRRVKAKGKENGVVGIPLLRALTLMRPRGVSGLQSVFVGRDGELELLLATYARAVEQRAPHLVTIMAGAGVGKTRLVRELWARLGRATPEPLRRTGRCLAYGQGITYWPLGEILKEHLGILESDPPEVVRERLGAREILGLALGLDSAPELHPLAARDRMHDAWVELLAELTVERPAVILFEDLHWAEEPLLDLVERLVRDVSGPLVVIGTARPELLETRPSWGGGLRNASQLWLEALHAEHTAQLVDALLAAPLPDSLREVIVERAEGNPFFVEELIETLIDRGVLVSGDGGWQAQELSVEFELPDTVHAVVAARMDLLPATEKAALQAAAVAGRIFWDGPVVELLDGAEPDFQLLEARDFIRRRSGSSMEGEREYAIKHAVTREVAYASVPKARRARLHAAFAAWLEGVGTGRDEHASLLAHHYAQAVHPDDVDLAWANEPAEADRLRGKAAFWLRRAGELAVARYDLEEAIALLHHAVELEQDAVVQAAIWREIGRANAFGFRGEEFWDAMERSLSIGIDPTVRGETYAELAYQTSFRAGMWNKAPDRDLVSSWIEHALRLSAPGTAARVKALCAQVFWSDESHPEAAREASASAEQIRDPELRASAFWCQALIAYHAGRFEEALDWAQRPLDFIDELRDPETIVEAYEATVPVHVMLGRFSAARTMAERHDEATQRLSPHHRLHGVAMTAELEELRADWEALRGLTPRLERAVAANLETPCIRNQRTLLVCAAASRALGDMREAERLEEKAESLGMEGYDLVLSGPRLRLALLKDDLGAIERLVDVISSAGLGRHAFWFYPSVQVAQLEALVRLGDHVRGEEEAAPLLEPGQTYFEPFAQRALGQIRGDRSLVEQGLVRFKELGLDWHARQTAALLTI
jgi:class 3 adenylate cyclase/tetratricopeptide (TPR) repeat protein